MRRGANSSTGQSLLPRGDRHDGELLAQYWSRGGYNNAMVSRSDDNSTKVVRRALADST